MGFYFFSPPSPSHAPLHLGNCFLFVSHLFRFSFLGYVFVALCHRFVFFFSLLIIQFGDINIFFYSFGGRVSDLLISTDLMILFLEPLMCFGENS